jgi:hypothetical protein
MASGLFEAVAAGPSGLYVVSKVADSHKQLRDRLGPWTQREWCVSIGKFAPVLGGKFLEKSRIGRLALLELDHDFGEFPL